MASTVYTLRTWDTYQQTHEIGWQCILFSHCAVTRRKIGSLKCREELFRQNSSNRSRCMWPQYTDHWNALQYRDLWNVCTTRKSVLLERTLTPSLLIMNPPSHPSLCCSMLLQRTIDNEGSLCSVCVQGRTSKMRSSAYEGYLSTTLVIIRSGTNAIKQAAMTISDALWMRTRALLFCDGMQF